MYLLKYKIDVLSEFKKHGYNTVRIRDEKITGQRQVQEYRDNKVTMSGIKLACQLLDCQPGDILEYIPDEE